MFLLKLYRFNKFAFFGLIAFIIAYIFINYKWGLVATPIYQFGMYSGLENKNGEYKTYAIIVNNQPLNLNNYAAPELDAMLIPVKQFKSQQENNSAVYNIFKNVFAKAGITTLLKQQNFINNITIETFNNWYSEALSKKLNYKVNSFQILSRNYSFQTDRLVAVDSSKIELTNAQ